jgi:hypothetical protein
MFHSVHRASLPAISQAIKIDLLDSSKSTQPIADREVRPTAVAKANRPDLVLQPPPPLYTHALTSSRFYAALQARLAILKADCCFDDPLRDRSAKEVKSKTLKELLDLAQDRVFLSCCHHLELVIAGVEGPILRDRERASPLHLRSDDFVPLTLSAWPHLEMHYRILTAIVAGCPDPSHFNAEYVRRLFQFFESPDLRERMALSTLILAIKDARPSLSDWVLKQALSALAGYRDQTESALVLQPALAILRAYLKRRPPSEENSEWNPIYFRCILPLAKANHYGLIQDEFAHLVDLFLATNSKEIASMTWKTLFHCFPSTRSAKAIEFLRLLTQSLAKASRREVHANMRAIFLLYARCAGSGDVRIVTASLAIWEKVALEPLICDNATVIFPLVYPIISQALKESWNPRLTGAIENILESLDRIDSRMFQELCRQRQKLTPEKDEAATWVSLARVACKNNPELNSAGVFAAIREGLTHPDYSSNNPKHPGEPIPRQTLGRQPLARSGATLVHRPSIKAPYHPAPLLTLCC